MNIEEIRDYCLSLPETTEGFPFDEETLVFKVCDKMFALTNLEGPLSINLKCEPSLAIELREKHSAVLPGYHMNKKHWNTILVDGTVPDRIIYDWITHSYNQVVKTLPKYIQQRIKKI